jgi:hypothetical protein
MERYVSEMLRSNSSAFSLCVFMKEKRKAYSDCSMHVDL